eukprot:535337_1
MATLHATRCSLVIPRAESKIICHQLGICNGGSPWHIPLSVWMKYYSMKGRRNKNQISKYYNLENVDYFCVVRNPLTKIISEYKYLVSSRSSSESFGANLLQNEVDLYDEHDFCDENVMNLWIQKAIIKYQKLLNKNSKLYYCERGCHFVRQYDFVYDEMDKQICKHIIHFENLNEELNDLLLEYNLPEISKELLQIHDNVGAYCSDAHLYVLNLTNYTKSIVYNMYKKDFIAFNYSL